MKALLLPMLMMLTCASLRAGFAVLDTPSFRIEIEHACEEGCVSCDRIRYRGVSKKTQRSIALSGSTVHTTGADKKAPSHFLGYRFVNGSTVYFVGHDGQFEVTQSGKRLLSEHGIWDHDRKRPNKAPEPTPLLVMPRATAEQGARANAHSRPAFAAQTFNARSSRIESAADCARGSSLTLGKDR